MGFNIIAKTAIQKTPALGINVRTILQPNIYYTCPAGKVAKVKGRVTCTGTGAAAEAHFLIDGTITYRWKNLGGGYVQNVIPDNTAHAFNSIGTDNETPTGVFKDFEFTLNAGEDFSTDQTSGTNAEFNVFAEVTESPA